MEESLNEARARVLDFWRAVELLSPQRLPKEDPSNRDSPVWRVSPREPLPWSLPQWGQPLDPEKARRFVLYCGAFDLASVWFILTRRIGKSAQPVGQSFDRARGGSSCMFALQLSGDGRPLFDTLTVASCPWALSQIAGQKPNWDSLASAEPRGRYWLDGFGEWSHSQRTLLERRWAVPQDDEEGIELLAKHRVGRRLEPLDLCEGLQLVLGGLRIARLLKPETSLLKTYLVPKERAFEPGDFDFLNSFFVDDLGRIAKELRNGNAGTALSRVLLPPEKLNEAERIDVRRSEEALWLQLAPDRFPHARWPAAVSESPYFSQQFAINAASAMFEDPNGGVLGVNGPPGTGKTTMLRELVASVIVKRAQALAALRRPGDAFDGEVTWKSDRYSRTVALWKPEFRGFEIVVASNNNRAVENVTLEIPSAAAIDPEWRDSVDYFADFATRLQRKTRGGGEAWALIAARFGNKKNRKQFRDSFWYQDHEIDQPASRAERGFAAYLLNVKARPNSWKEAVRDFESALRIEAGLRKERSDQWASANAFKETTTRLRALEAHVRECSALAQEAEQQLNLAEGDHRLAEESRSEAVAKRKEHQAFKPSLVDAVFSMGSAYREWSGDDARYAAHVAEAEAGCERAAGWLAVCRERQRTARAKHAATEHELAATQQTLRALEKFNSHQWPENSEARELSFPWSDERWNHARTSVLLKALNLHRVFVECLSLRLRQNLWAVMDLLSGRIPSGVDEESAASAWATMFFVVPVISTTFASFHRLFSHLGRESLGWLLMDEAGQTAPQAAAGAIWRSKRVVATGDPLQLEPIVSLPYTSQEALRNYFRVDEIWMLSLSSAQWLVDRASRYGTYLESEVGERPVWVGCPLRVHRRCEQPMFNISNRIAYAGQMVYATQPEPQSDLSPSRWLDVPSEQAEGRSHWISDEGLVLEVLLTELIAGGVQRNSILLITPFRSVAVKLRPKAKKFGIRKAGTIHVAQGAEADVVILVLGSNPASDAAREWASERPNLLNVAVSRAKRRLYIIGNRGRWGHLPHFSVAAELLHGKTVAVSA